MTAPWTSDQKKGCLGVFLFCAYAAITVTTWTYAASIGSEHTYHVVSGPYNTYTYECVGSQQVGGPGEHQLYSAECDAAAKRVAGEKKWRPVLKVIAILLTAFPFVLVLYVRGRNTRSSPRAAAKNASATTSEVWTTTQADSAARAEWLAYYRRTGEIHPDARRAWGEHSGE